MHDITPSPNAQRRLDRQRLRDSVSYSVKPATPLRDFLARIYYAIFGYYGE
jgi:hypothetical protein